MDLGAWLGTGLSPTANAQGAMVYAFMAMQGFLVAVAGLMALFITLRWLAGQMAADRPSTTDLIALFVIYTAGQGIIAGLLLRLFPGA
jgi:cytochrome c oxidase subunit I+III